jgi:hypothetical protein
VQDTNGNSQFSDPFAKAIQSEIDAKSAIIALRSWCIYAGYQFSNLEIVVEMGDDGI